LEDSGELATAAQVLGVPHPPGYPLWTMLGWLFCRLFGWVTWQGYANPAWAVALFSAVSGAFATALTALLAVKSGRELLQTEEDDASSESVMYRERCAWWGGVAGSLCFAFSPVMWSQAVIVEVYALGALFMAAVMLLTYCWLRHPSGRILVWLGLIFGLGLTNYQVLLLAALPIALVVFLRQYRLAFSFVALAVPLVLTAYILSLGALPSADVFSTPGAPVILRPDLVQCVPTIFYVFVAIAVLGVAFTAMFAKQLKYVAFPAVALMGLILFSELRWAPDVLPQDFAGTLYPFAKAWLVHMVALGGLWWISWRKVQTRRFALVITIVQVALLFLLQQGLLLGLEHPTTGWFWWGIVWNLLVLWMAWRTLEQGKIIAATILAAELGVSVYAYMPLVSDCLNPAMNWGYARTWEGFKHAISRGQYEAIAPATFFSRQYLLQLWDYFADLRLQFSLPVVGIAIVGTMVLVVRVVRDRLRGSWVWLLSTLLFFVVMSALLVALANPSGDLQDGFIQKVKFISSHGVFALWVSYGLLALLVYLTKHFSRKGFIVGVMGACAVAMLPIVENAVDERLIHRMGAAEQTNHDFGWQFGAYMLGGAPTIQSELSDDEEPLPDPFWPPPMEQDAVLFGGTDPGRFVPTYMVHAVGFRPDIFVLTQNALADPTYMNVERDLYGDTLWLPTADNVRNAFTDYVDAVQSGKRTTAGKIVEVNGKMSITGSSAVMDINADLAQQIFERNPNPFYVEESYTMEWMNAYLAPAGLAMQLHREPNRDLMTIASRDADFWDWMVRRLTSRIAYRRDFAAKKSFSKLRSSIAGVYATRGYSMFAERAFMDAFRLYPVSSDAVFRTIREAYLPTGQFLTAYRLICRYLITDPQNSRARRLEGRLEEAAMAYRRFEQLAKLHSENQLSTALRCELAEVCETLGMKLEAIGHWKQMATAEDLTARGARDGCIALQRLREFELAMTFLQRVPEAVWPTFTEAEIVASAGLAQTYGHLNLAFAIFQSALKTYPTSGRVWLGIALYYYEAGNERQAYECMCAAVRNGAAGLIENDPAVADIFLRLMRYFGPQKGAQ
jgi:tetratricopeptide (TPR) repeat protein